LSEVRHYYFRKKKKWTFRALWCKFINYQAGFEGSFKVPPAWPERGHRKCEDANLANEKNEVFLQGDYRSSTETDTEFDIVHELKGVADDIEKAIRISSEHDVLEKISYLRFLLGELDDALSEPYKELRVRRFITKKTA
jgi:hypothetical protein